MSTFYGFLTVLCAWLGVRVPQEGPQLDFPVANKEYRKDINMSKSIKRAKGKLYTAFIVRDSNSRRFLNQRSYTGRRRGQWGPAGEAEIFYKELDATSCATSINRRRPEGYSAYDAEVVAIKVRGRGRRIG